MKKTKMTARVLSAILAVIFSLGICNLSDRAAAADKLYFTEQICEYTCVDMSSEDVECLSLTDRMIETSKEVTKASNQKEPSSTNPFASIISAILDIFEMLKEIIDFINNGFPGLPFGK